TFYDERIADESYLNTALFPESVRALIRLLGYRPRPGIAATGVVGARLTVPAPPGGVTLPRGFAVQSKPAPGQEPQIFEADQEEPLAVPGDTESSSPADALQPVPASDVIAAEPPIASDALIQGDGKSVLMSGSVTVQVGEKLLLLKRPWDGSAGQWAFSEVAAVAHERDPHRQPMTRVTFGDLA